MRYLVRAERPLEIRWDIRGRNLMAPQGDGTSWRHHATSGPATARKTKHAAVEIETGWVFVNEIVKSDARLRCGGIDCSGFGRELSHLESRDFTNAKTVWIA